MNCYDFKGGSGDRLAARGATAATTYTVGVFLQANFGARDELTIAGVPLGSVLADDNPMRDCFTAAPPGCRLVHRAGR